MVHGHTAQAAHDALREVRVLLGHVLEVEELDGQLPARMPRVLESSPDNALFPQPTARKSVATHRTCAI